MQLFNQAHPYVKTLVFWLEQTHKANAFPFEKLVKIAPYELTIIARSCEQCVSYSDEFIAGIEDETEKPFRWKYAKNVKAPCGFAFHNPNGGNDYLTNKQTDKAVFRGAEVAISAWLKQVQP